MDTNKDTRELGKGLIGIPPFLMESTTSDNIIKPMACYENCEYTCMPAKEGTCGFCEDECQGCLGACQTPCQINTCQSCQTPCQLDTCQSCQTPCQLDTCQSCQDCQSCESEQYATQFNITEMGKDQNGVAVRAWYGGGPAARAAVQCLFYCDGSWFATENYPSPGSRNWTTNIYSKTGLMPNTSYRFHAVFYNTAYTEIGRTQSIYVTTNPLTNPPPTPGSMSSTGRTETSISVTWGSSAGASGYRVYLDGVLKTTTSGTSTTISGLQHSSSYEICVAAYNSIGESPKRCVRTSTATPVPGPPDYVSISNITQTGCFISWSSSTGATKYQLIVEEASGGVVINQEITGTSYSVTGLNPGVAYNAYVRAGNAGGWSGYTTRGFVTVAADTTPPIISSVQASSAFVSNAYRITLTWSSYDNVAVTHHWVYITNNSGTYISEGVTLAGDATTYTFTKNGSGAALQANQTYGVMVRAVDAEGNVSTQASGTVQVTVKSGRPLDWAWEYNITSGGTFYSQSADGKTAYLMRAAHWNDFTKRINEFRQYKALNAYTFTTASTSTSSSGVTSCINQAINAINEMLNTGKMANISTGTVVRASIFTDMRDKLNSII